MAVLFDSPRRLAAFLEEARAERFSRAAGADLAAVDPAFLAALGATEERRIKASVTIVADHLYVEVGGRSMRRSIARLITAPPRRRPPTPEGGGERRLSG